MQGTVHLPLSRLRPEEPRLRQSGLPWKGAIGVKPRTGRLTTVQVHTYQLWAPEPCLDELFCAPLRLLSGRSGLGTADGAIASTGF